MHVSHAASSEDERPEVARSSRQWTARDDAGSSQASLDINSSSDTEGSEDDGLAGSTASAGRANAPELTLGELAKLKRDGGRSGRRPPQPSQRRREAGRSERPASSDEDSEAAEKGGGSAPRKKKARHGPSEASSKRQVPVFRKAFDAAGRKIRDPRYDSIGERADAQQVRERFRRRYDFVFEEEMPQERAEIRAALRKTKSAEKREELRARLSRIDQTLAEDARRRKRGAFGKEIKAKEKQAVAAGKKPYYLKASEQKRLSLEAQFAQLKDSGQLDKFLEKRRKKVAAKDHRLLPVGRRSAELDL